MVFHSKVPKEIKGRVVHKHTGYSIILPPDWIAYAIETDFIMGNNIEHGKLLFSVIHHTELIGDERTGTPLSGEDIIMDDAFKTTSFYDGEKMVKMWELSTGNYFVRFMYVCNKPDYNKEMETISAIVHSLNTTNS